MRSEYLTEIIRKSARNTINISSSVDFAELQKNQMLSQLYSQVDKYYRDNIDKKEFGLGFCYDTQDNVEYAIAYIYDNKTGEQIL